MGIVPGNLEGAIVSNDFPTFNVRGDVLLPDYLNWISKTPDFVELCWRSSEGTTNRVRLKEDRFLSMSIPLPSVAEQQQIVARIDKCAENVAELNRLLQASDHDLANMLMSKYRNLIESAVWHPMERVAPVVRRSVQVDFTSTYPELGIRSFGRGTFHKPTVSGASLGTKRLYRIAAGDLVFNNVFAWEGAVAVAQPDDGGRVGSHRFISCVPFEGVATAEFLCFHFLSVEGLRQLGDASPGGAGRNRTLGLKALARAQVPVPPIDSQHHFDQLQTMVANIRRLRQVQKSKLDAVLPAVLDRAFKGEQ
jgi:type I restriction enzyme S subunit